MPRHILHFLLLVLTLTILTACGDDDDDDADVCPVVVSDADCDTSQRPIVFVHGTFGSGDNVANLARLFGSNGYCQDRFVAVEYNSLGEDPFDELDPLIDQVLAQTGMDKVELMGHSQGTLHASNYLADPEHAAKVAHYVHFAGGPRAEPPGGVPTISFGSEADFLGPDGVIGAEQTVVFTDHDHFGVASSTETFIELYKYLRGEEPEYTTVQCGDEMVTIEGRAVSFADNAYPVGSKLEVYELGDEPYERGEPYAVLECPEDGRTEPLQVKRNTPYEFRGIAADGSMIGHMYFGGFKRSDRLVRFLVPSEHPVAGAVTNHIDYSDDFSVIIARQIEGAFRADLGDSLTLDGEEILDPSFADAEAVTVGLFIFDENGNGINDGGPMPFYDPISFVNGTDIFLDTATPRFIELNFNGNVMKVPNWPSQTWGPTLIMFQ